MPATAQLVMDHLSSSSSSPSSSSIALQREQHRFDCKQSSGSSSSGCSSDDDSDGSLASRPQREDISVLPAKDPQNFDNLLLINSNKAAANDQKIKLNNMAALEAAAAAAAASNVNDDDNQREHELEAEPEQEEIKCSAVHSLERDMPDYDYSHLVNELRDRILKDCQLNVGLYAERDVEKCKHDQWFIERFLLRQKLDLDKALDMLRRTMRFRNESLASSIRREDFPAEFYQVGGLFCYEEDRKGNKMLYIRLKVHRKIPEIQLVLQAFLFYNIHYLDEQANGKGIAIVLDCTGGGLVNADVDMMMYLISTLVNYFPKGMSYLLVHELPWILKPFWYIAKGFLAEEHSELIKFSNSKTIYEYVRKENLPDFMGGTCERSYKTPPENCTTLEQACKLWGIEPQVGKKLLLKFAQWLPAETMAKFEGHDDDNDNDGAISDNVSDQEELAEPAK